MARLSSDTHQDTVPLLPIIDAEERCSDSSEGRSRSTHHEKVSNAWRTQDYPQIRKYLVIQSVAFGVYVFASIAALVFLQDRACQQGRARHHLIELPAFEAVKWETRQFPTDIVTNDFVGNPRPELEAAWHNLLQNDNVAIPRDVLSSLGLSSVYIKGGIDGVASLGVYHALHCLKKVRHMTFKEHYHADKGAGAMARERRHADHCIEYIRETLMCHADLSLVTYRWINETAQHPTDPSARFPTSFDVSHHECVNWELLSDWAAQRRVDLYQTDLLQPPETKA